MNKGTSQYPRCVLITFVLVICVFNCFQVCYVQFKPLQRGGSCDISLLGPQGLSNGEFRWVKVETVGKDIEGPTDFQWTYDVGFPYLLNVGFMILWYSKNWNPEIWKSPEEKKNLHSLNSAIKELVYSFFNFDSEETSRISDKKDTDHATKKKTHQNGSNDSIVANGFLGQLWPVC